MALHPNSLRIQPIAVYLQATPVNCGHAACSLWKPEWKQHLPNHLKKYTWENTPDAFFTDLVKLWAVSICLAKLSRFQIATPSREGAIRDVTRPRWHRQRDRTSLTKGTEVHWMAVHVRYCQIHFGTFLRRPCKTTTWNDQILRFVENVNLMHRLSR